MANIKFPDYLKDAFKIAAGLSPEARRRVIEVVQSSRIGGKWDNLAEVISSTAEITHEGAKDLLYLISGIEGLLEREEAPSGEAVKQLVDGYAGSDPENPDFDRAELEEFLGSLMNEAVSGNLRLTQKAFTLTFDRENVVHDTKLLLDVRPVFGGPDSDELRALTLLYNLKVVYSPSIVSPQGATAKVFALDEKDLKRLKESIARAEMKAAAIQEQFNQVPFIYPNINND